MGYKSGLGCARDRNVHGPGNTPKVLRFLIELDDSEVCERPLRIRVRQKSSYGLIVMTSVKGPICRASSVTVVAGKGEARLGPTKTCCST